MQKKIDYEQEGQLHDVKTMNIGDLVSIRYLKNIVKCVISASKHYEGKCIVEQHFITEMRKSSYNPMSQAFKSKKDFDELTSTVIYEPEKIPTKRLMNTMSKKIFHHKAKICIEQVLFHDILKCIIKWL